MNIVQTLIMAASYLSIIFYPHHFTLVSYWNFYNNETNNRERKVIMIEISHNTSTSSKNNSLSSTFRIPFFLGTSYKQYCMLKVNLKKKSLPKLPQISYTLTYILYWLYFDLLFKRLKIKS